MRRSNSKAAKNAIKAHILDTYNEYVTTCETGDEIRASQDAYARRKYPAHYTPYTIKDNYGKGKDWNGYICWYHYYTTI